MGTSYSVNNSAITNSYFSMLKSPYGLPDEFSNIINNFQVLGNTSLSKSEKEKKLITIFNGTTASGAYSTISTTWQALGLFKSLYVELYNSSTNGYSNIMLPFYIFSSGTYLNNLARNTNIYGANYLNDNVYHIHNIPANNIGANTIMFDGYSPLVISRIFIEY